MYNYKNRYQDPDPVKSRDMSNCKSVGELLPMIKHNIAMTVPNKEKERQWEKDQLVRRLNELGFRIEVKG